MIGAADGYIGAFVFATAVRIVDEMVVPPLISVIIDEMMDDAIAKRGGKNLADDWIMRDEGDAATGVIMTGENFFT